MSQLTKRRDYYNHFPLLTLIEKAILSLMILIVSYQKIESRKVSLNADKTKNKVFCLFFVFVFFKPRIMLRRSMTWISDTKLKQKYTCSMKQ